jgi:EmrB/QacA subfamily drug resistance transporter
MVRIVSQSSPVAPSAALAAGAQRSRTIFVVTALGAFMASLDLSIVNVAFPALERAFSHDTRASLAWVITGYSIVFGSLLVIAGRTADRLGSRRLFFSGLGVFCTGSALCGVAPTVTLLIAGRVVQGVGAAALLPASLSLLLGAYSPQRRSQVVAMWGGIGALAVATGPSFGALLITGFGWRAAFYVNLPVGLIAYLLGRRVLSETKRNTEPSSPDYPGVALLGLSLAALVLAISEGPTWGWSSSWIVSSFAVALVLGATFLFRSSRHSEPVLDLTLFRERSFSVANAATFLYATGFFAMLLGNILFLTGVWHYSILDAGLGVTPGPLVVAVVSGPAGRLAGRVGFRPILLVGFAIFACGVSWYTWRVGLRPEYLTVWLPGSLTVGLGIGLTFPLLSASAVSSLRPERFAVGSSVNQTARQIGGAIGVALLIVIVGPVAPAAVELPHFRHLWIYIAAMALFAGCTCLLLTKRTVSPSTPPDRSDSAERATEHADSSVTPLIEHARTAKESSP